MKIKSINRDARLDSVYDIETASHNYILSNGIVSHNTMELYSKPVVGGGTGNMYSSNDVWIIGRSQEKDSEGVNGWTFTINIDKSRRVKEKAKIPVTVMFDGGIKRESGLMDLGLDMKFIIKPSNGWYSKVLDIETGEVEDKKYRAADMNYDWYKFMLDSPVFQEMIKKKYQLGTGALLIDDSEFEHVVEGDGDE